jgi:hypothetical protein
LSGQITLNGNGIGGGVKIGGGIDIGLRHDAPEKVRTALKFNQGDIWGTSSSTTPDAYGITFKNIKGTVLESGSIATRGRTMFVDNAARGITGGSMMIAPGPINLGGAVVNANTPINIIENAQTLNFIWSDDAGRGSPSRGGQRNTKFPNGNPFGAGMLTTGSLGYLIKGGAVTIFAVGVTPDGPSNQTPPTTTLPNEGVRFTANNVHFGINDLDNITWNVNQTGTPRWITRVGRTLVDGYLLTSPGRTPRTNVAFEVRGAPPKSSVTVSAGPMLTKDGDIGDTTLARMLHIGAGVNTDARDTKTQFDPLFGNGVRQHLYTLNSPDAKVTWEDLEKNNKGFAVIVGQGSVPVSELENKEYQAALLWTLVYGDVR